MEKYRRGGNIYNPPPSRRIISSFAPVPDIAQMYPYTGQYSQLPRIELQERGFQRSSLMQLGPPRSLVSAVDFMHQTSIGGWALLWMESGLSLQGLVHLNTLLFRRTVVGHDWYGCARDRQCLRLQQLRNWRSDPRNLAIQVHHLSDIWTHFYFYTAYYDHELMSWLA